MKSFLIEPDADSIVQGDWGAFPTSKRSFVSQRHCLHSNNLALGRLSELVKIIIWVFDLPSNCQLKTKRSLCFHIDN